MGKDKRKRIEIKNRRASFEYEFIEKFTAGIVLCGTEIKSIREGKASLVDSYCYFSGNELYVKNMNISEYWWASYNRQDPRRDRKLLLTKRELRKLFRASRDKGMTIVATSLFIADNGYAKLILHLQKANANTTNDRPLRKKIFAAIWIAANRNIKLIWSVTMTTRSLSLSLL